MKRDAEDWSRQDVELYLCAPKSLTFEQVQALDFPAADYAGEDGAPFWFGASIQRWLEAYDTAFHTSDRARNPVAFASILEDLNRLARRHE